MNSGHAKMADWGMKNHTVDEIEDALRAVGFSKTKSYHHKSKPWITVVARK